MRILHTADWHLGHMLGDCSREYEHRCFLNWLLDTLVNESVDALIVAGDIFDTANPSSSAQKMYYEFLADAHRRVPKLNVLIIGGNHDSQARLDAPRELLQRLNIHVIGGLHSTDGEFDIERLVVPLIDAKGKTRAWVAAVPYLRPIDLPAPEQTGLFDQISRTFVDGVRDIYAKVTDAARKKCGKGEFLLATGHCFLAKAQTSPKSERRILIGGEEALPPDIFPEDVAYVALGHLHCPQRVGGREIRYSGSPIPLDISEAGYQHQVLLVELEKDVAVTPLRIPAVVEFKAVPADGPRELSEVLRLLNELPGSGDIPRERWPYLEVRVRLTRPEPLLHTKIEDAVSAKAVRLIKISRDKNFDEMGPVLLAPTELKSLSEEDVFKKLYAREYKNAEIPADLMNAFRVLLEEVRQEEAQE